MEKKRIKWIDSLRGFSILLIAYGHILVHCEELQWLKVYLYSFHVPIFFVISAITFNVKREYQYKKFFIKKFKRIMIPYFVFALLYLIPYLILGERVGQQLDINGFNNIGRSLFGIIYGNGHNNLLKQNSSLWFLPCLFIVEQIFFFVEKLRYRLKKEEKRYYTFFTFIFAILGYIVYIIPHTRMPWGLEVGIVLSTFFCIGKIIKLNIEYVYRSKKIIGMAYCGILLGLIICFSNSAVSCMNHNYGNYFIFMVSAIISCLSYIVIFRNIPENKTLTYIGMKTMGILIFHKLLIVLAQTKLGKVTYFLNKGNWLQETILSIIVLIISIVFSIFITNIVERYIPSILGNNKRDVKK